jgi:hypothetical protein
MGGNIALGEGGKLGNLMENSWQLLGGDACLHYARRP